MLFHGQHILVPAPVLVRGEKDSCLLAGCLHLIELLHTHGSGLFGNNVLPGFGGLDAHFLVQIVGNGQDNGIDLRICQKLIRIRIQPIPHFNCFFLFSSAMSHTAAISTPALGAFCACHFPIPPKPMIPSLIIIK